MIRRRSIIAWPGTVGPDPATIPGYVLLEDGSYVLLEDDGLVELEEGA